MAAYALAQIARNGLYGATDFIYVGDQLVDARPVIPRGRC